VANVQRSRSFRKKGGILGLNIGKNAVTPIENAVDDYLIALAGVYPHADYVTVNISSPNTKNLRALQSDEALDALLGALTARQRELMDQHQRRVPLFLKIAPDLDEAQIAVIACRRRDRHQHHAQPRGRQGPAPCRGNRRPVGPAGAGGQQQGDPRAAQPPGPELPHHRRGRGDERRRRLRQAGRRRGPGAGLHRPDLPPGAGARRPWPRA
jgi:hypothetical protein